MAGTGFWWALLACAFYGIVHSALASDAIKAFVERKFGLKVKRNYRFIYVIVASITIIPLLAAVVIPSDAVIYTIPTPWVYLTLTLQVASVACLVTTVLQTKPLTFVGVAALINRGRDEPETLYTQGFYAFVRHPLYFFSFILMWLFPIMTWNLLGLFIGLMVYTVLGSLLEERRLLRQFGEDYRAYQKKTPWLIPFKLPRG
jgi:methanethiol S-methyltransferase